MPELRLGVLGALEVHVDGSPREIPPGRQRAVLACLAVHHGHAVSADALIEAAWGDDLPQEPLKALNTVLSRLRSALGRTAIEAVPGGYRLAGAMLDAADFEALVQRARTAEPGESAELLGRALGLWRGPAFGEYADAPFALAAAGALGRVRADAVEARGAALVQAGEPAGAVEGLAGLLEQEPFRERAVEVLATALYQCGRQAEALERLRAHRALLAEELGLDPAPGLQDLEERILGHRLAPPRTAGPPPWLDTSTAFIGREDAVDDLVAAVTAHPLTVLTGPGGVGKSRLAAESLGPLDAALGLPIVVVELAAVGQDGGAHEVAGAVADALGLGRSGGAEVGAAGEAVVEFLAAVPHLLVLDNCEHLLDELAPLVATIARRCRDVRVLATSRHRLGVASEVVMPLAPLRLPDPGTSPGSQGSTAAVRLLGDRVRRLRPAFAVTEENSAQVAELCRRCDGLPLALELAASRVAATGVADVLTRFPDAGLDEVVDWSYRLLAPPERALLDSLSVFAGDFTAEEVRGLWAHLGEEVEPRPGPAALAELVESSLVAHHGGAASSHHLLDMVRTYASRRLQSAGRADLVRGAHARWVRDLVVGIRDDWSRGDGADLSARLSRLTADAAAALRWALDEGDLVLASQISHSITRCWHWTVGPQLRDLLIEVGERAEHADRASDTASDTANDTAYDTANDTAYDTVAGGLASAAFHLSERGEVSRAVELGTRALARTRDLQARVTASLALGVAEMYSGDHGESRRHYGAAADDPELIGEANSALALLACYADDLVTAGEHAAIALAAGASGSDHSLAFARYAAGEVEARTDPARGMALLEEAVAEADRAGAEQVGRVARIALFGLVVREGRTEDAVRLGGRVLADLRRLGAWIQVWTMVRLLAELLADAGRWADAAFLLGAAQGAPSAPPPVGADIERYAVLQADLSAHLGARVTEQIVSLAAATPRAQVLSRAERVLENLGGSTSRPAAR